jgi:hypothetical protein
MAKQFNVLELNDPVDERNMILRNFGASENPKHSVTTQETLIFNPVISPDFKFVNLVV